MPYTIIEIEVTQPLPTISISRHDTGIAVLLRYKGKPIDFWMEVLPANSILTPEDLARCLESLRSLQPPAFGTPDLFEILVVDNAPSDQRTRELVVSFPEVSYICESKPGLDFARNRALQEAKGELLAYLDDDVIADRRWLAGLMEAWAENPDAAAFTGLVLPYELATEAQIMFEQRGGFRRGFNKIRYYGQNLPGKHLYPCGAGIFGAGANMAFRRDILLKLGGFDEALDTGSRLRQ